MNRHSYLATVNLSTRYGPPGDEKSCRREFNGHGQSVLAVHRYSATAMASYVNYNLSLCPVRPSDKSKTPNHPQLPRIFSLALVLGQGSSEVGVVAFRWLLPPCFCLMIKKEGDGEGILVAF